MGTPITPTNLRFPHGCTSIENSKWVLAHLFLRWQQSSRPKGGGRKLSSLPVGDCHCDTGLFDKLVFCILRRAAVCALLKRSSGYAAGLRPPPFPCLKNSTTGNCTTIFLFQCCPPDGRQLKCVECTGYTLLPTPAAPLLPASCVRVWRSCSAISSSSPLGLTALCHWADPYYLVFCRRFLFLIQSLKANSAIVIHPAYRCIVDFSSAVFCRLSNQFVYSNWPLLKLACGAPSKLTGTVKVTSDIN